MDKLRVAVMMEECLPSEGGGYSYYQTLLASINNHSFHPGVEIVNIDFSQHDSRQSQSSKRVIRVKKSFTGELTYRLLGLLYKLLHRLLNTHAKRYLEFIAGLMDEINNKAAVKVLNKENIDLVYYLKPTQNLINYPMIVTHWDVGHKSMYPFPEVAGNGNYEKKEKYYKKMLSRAFLILCESYTGAKELQHYYPVNPDKINVLPLFSGQVINQAVSAGEQLKILSDFKLSQHHFFIYPAQFWAHKNHSTLIHAFHSLLMDQDNKSLKLVLCGGDQGNLSYIKVLIDNLGLNDHIMLPGFITDKHLYVLYKNAIALVMPTFLGPTNIPLLEAAQLECAVICSNLEGHREMLGKNALYFDPVSILALKDCLQKLLNNELRKQLAACAYRHIKNSCFQVERSIPLLDQFLQRLKPVRKTWGMNLTLLCTLAEISF